MSTAAATSPRSSCATTWPAGRRPTRPASTSPTTLTLSASPTSIAYGGTTRLTAVLKVADVGAYYRLKINPISERTVRLQRRAPGASTWTTVGTMPATGASGTYSLSQKLQTDAEYRATFTAPSSEGLGQRHQRHRPRDRRRLHRQLPAVRAGRGGGRHVTARRGRPVLALAIMVVLAGCGGPATSPIASGAPTATSATTASSEVVPDASGAPPTPTAVAATTIPPSSVAGVAEPPVASLAAEGGDPVVGQLGSYIWADGGSDAPWLPGRTDHRRSGRAAGDGRRLPRSASPPGRHA